MLKGKPWQIGLGALGAVLLVMGQVAIIQSRYANGAALSAAGILCAASAFIAPLVPWGRAFELLRGLFLLLPSLLALLKRKKAAAALPAAKGKASLSRRTAAPAPQALPWRPFTSDTLVLSRHTLVIPIFLLALAGYFGAVVGQKMVMGIAALVFLLLLMAVYLQDLERPMSFPSMNQNFKSLLKLCLGLPFQAMGFWLLWGYKYVYSGYFLVVLGSAIMIAVLMLSPFNFVEDEAATSDQLDFQPESPWWNSGRLIMKSTCIAASVLCAYVAEELAGKQPGFSVTAGFLAMGLLVLSFPWLPSSLADWEALPKIPRALAALGLAAFALVLGIKGQALIDAGNINGGLWRFLAAGILLVLALPRVNRPWQEREDSSGGWPLRLEMLLVLLLFLAALQLRVFNLENFPYGAEGDEAGGGMFAMEALKGKVDNALVTANVPLHYYSITSIFFKIFGLSLAAMRAHAVIFGVLSILSTYYFVRLFYGVVIALLISFLMNFSYWHLHYSRFGHYNMEQVAMQMVAFYFVFKAMKRGKPWHFAAGGMAFGFAMLPHLASRLLPLAGIALVLYFFMTRRDLLRRHLPGFMIFVIASWMIAAPCLTYWFRAIPASLGRAQSVSIFDKTNSNAPVDTLSGFVHNSKISMLMFNHYSDSRTRNNPVAPQKILENWTAILFAIAFAYMLYHWRDPLAFFLLMLFFINLSASIFSVEAPQTLRTAGNISVIYCMIAFLLYDLLGAFQGLGRRTGAVLFALLLVPAFGFFSYRSWQKYFVEARNLTFDAVPTYVAGVAGTKGTANDQAVFFATGFASSHPPVLLFAQETPIRNFYNASDYLPISLVSNKTHLLFFCDSFEGLTPWVQTLYPGAKPGTIPHQTAPGQNLGTYFVVPASEIAEHLGLEALVDGKMQLKNAPLSYPSKEIPHARSIRWKGSVRFENYGLYRFSAAGRGDCQLRLAGQTVYSRRGGGVNAPEVRLPMGILPLEADLTPSGEAPFSITWVARPHPARMLYSFKGTASGTLEKRQLYDYPVQGFYGQYYVSREFKGDSVMEYVEPTVLAHWLDSPLPGNWSAVWKAKFHAPLKGPYRFSVSTFGSFAEVRVDGKLVHRGGSPPVPELHAPTVAPGADLNPGEHDLEVRFFTAGPSWYELRVSMPGQPEQLMPPMLLRPVYPHF